MQRAEWTRGNGQVPTRPSAIACLVGLRQGDIHSRDTAYVFAGPNRIGAVGHDGKRQRVRRWRGGVQVHRLEVTDVGANHEVRVAGHEVHRLVTSGERECPGITTGIGSIDGAWLQRSSRVLRDECGTRVYDLVGHDGGYPVRADSNHGIHDTQEGLGVGRSIFGGAVHLVEAGQCAVRTGDRGEGQGDDGGIATTSSLRNLSRSLDFTEPVDDWGNLVLVGASLLLCSYCD